MSEKYSDVLIVGSDLAGLIAGAFLAKRGLLVTVVFQEKELISPKANIGPNLISALESRLFKSILGRLSLMEHELKILRKLTVPYQIVMPEHRLDLYSDREKLAQELKREFPEDHQ
ncbi:MAG: FAD-dependent monooxygenase, partial [Deltaproteobacteria bacterium]|nr:FAD-dependent monooxygenase [Deltaproteobacteria bacterium]